MNVVTVGFLGGPHDGKLRTFPERNDGTRLPEPVLEVAEFVEPGENGGRPIKAVTYRLAVNSGNDGPLLYYVHPSVTFPPVP